MWGATFPAHHFPLLPLTPGWHWRLCSTCHADRPQSHLPVPRACSAPQCQPRGGSVPPTGDSPGGPSTSHPLAHPAIAAERRGSNTQEGSSTSNKMSACWAHTFSRPRQWQHHSPESVYTCYGQEHTQAGQPGRTELCCGSHARTCDLVAIAAAVRHHAADHMLHRTLLLTGSCSGRMGPKWSLGTLTMIRPLAALARPLRTARSVVKASAGRDSSAWQESHEHGSHMQKGWCAETYTV
jgi:hypothetical protein